MPGPINWNEEEEEDDSEQVAARQNVSVSFYINKDRCAQMINLTALLDTGSPISFISRGAVADGVAFDGLQRSGYHGLGNTPVYVLPSRFNSVLNRKRLTKI